jgi:hypothetical protein
MYNFIIIQRDLWCTENVMFVLKFGIVTTVPYKSGMANPRPASKNLQKKIIFVPIKYSRIPAKRGSHIINNIIATNYLIRRQNLCSQVFSMNHVILVVIKTVNYIRSHALPHRQFNEFLKELDLEYGYKNNNNSFCLFQIINTPKLIL